MKLKVKYKKFLYRFVLNIILLITLWLLFYNIFRNNFYVDFVYEEGIYNLTKIQLFFSKLVLKLLGHQVEIFGKTIKIIGSYGVHLDRGCLGRNTLGLFIGFILAFPGKIYNKIWFIFVGIIIFVLLNVTRIVGLAVTDYCCKEYLDFNHHFLFKAVVYAVIFFMWMIWIRKFSFLAAKIKEKPE